MANVIRVAIVEDRPEEREELLSVLEAAAGFTCVAVCPSSADALEMLPRVQPDVVLMDIQMPGKSGIECVRKLRPLLPQTQFMMLTVYEDHEAIFESLAAGATGYLLKKTPTPKLLEAIRDLRDGGAPMSGQIARKVVAAFRHQPDTPRTRATGPSEAPLSPIEEAVLQLLARGLLYKEVADKLQMSGSTVRTHVWHIYRKLQVHNRTEAVLKGLGQASGTRRLSR